MHPDGHRREVGQSPNTRTLMSELKTYVPKEHRPTIRLLKYISLNSFRNNLSKRQFQALAKAQKQGGVVVAL